MPPKSKKAETQVSKSEAVMEDVAGAGDGVAMDIQPEVEESRTKRVQKGRAAKQVPKEPEPEKVKKTKKKVEKEKPEEKKSSTKGKKDQVEKNGVETIKGKAAKQKVVKTGKVTKKNNKDEAKQEDEDEVGEEENEVKEHDKENGKEEDMEDAKEQDKDDINEAKVETKRGAKGKAKELAKQKVVKTGKVTKKNNKDEAKQEDEVGEEKNEGKEEDKDDEEDKENAKEEDMGDAKDQDKDDDINEAEVETKRGAKGKAKELAKEEDITEESNGVRKRRAPKANKKEVKEEPRLKRNRAGSKEPAEPVVQNKTSTEYSEIQFTNMKSNALGEQQNYKISSWNVDGLRAWIKKNGMEFIKREDPDILCLQETKCSTDKLPKEMTDIENYKCYWHNSEKEGYAGVALLSKTEPISVSYGINNKDQDGEGRSVTAEFDEFYVISLYVPNAGRGLVTLPKRLEWNEAFLLYIQELDKKKPVIICGDMNVAHEEIDLKNPQANKKNAGFTQEERDGMADFLSNGFLDTYRKFYPEEKDCYTFWSYITKARAKNVGWRLDYFLVSERFMEKVCDNVIRKEVYGSDHCPITLFLRK